MHFAIINSIHNNYIRHVSQIISNNNYRSKYNQTILEGIHLIERGADFNIKPEYCIISEEKLYDLQNNLNTKLYNSCKKLLIVTNNIWSKLTSLPNDDILWVVDTKQLIKDFKNINLNTSGIILDNIQDSGNMGNIIRTAAAANYSWVLAIGGANICSPKVLRAAMGGHFCLDIFQVNLLELANIQSVTKNANIMVTVQNAQKNIYTIDLPNQHIWVIGNEGNGIDKSWLDIKSIIKVGIPQNSNLESLNAASAAAICMYENIRRNLTI